MGTLGYKYILYGYMEPLGHGDSDTAGPIFGTFGRPRAAALQP